MIAARRLSRALLLGCLLGLGAAVGAEAAEPEPPTPTGASSRQHRTSRRLLAKAQRHFDLGAAHYDAGEYPEARFEFEEAYRISRLPDLLYNLARVEARLGHREAAAQYYETFLRDQPDTPDAATIREEIARLRASPAGGGPVLPALPSRSPRPALWPPISLASAGVAVLLTGIILGASARAAARSLEAAQAPGRGFDPELQALEARGKALSAAGVALDVIGGLALGAGLAWTGVALYQRRARLALLPSGWGPDLQVTF